MCPPFPRKRNPEVSFSDTFRCDGVLDMIPGRSANALNEKPPCPGWGVGVLSDRLGAVPGAVLSPQAMAVSAGTYV